MKNKNEDLFNSLFNRRKNKTSLRISLTENKKNNFGKDENFKKSINSLILNINGEKPLIVYKKSPSKIRTTEIKHNNYLSDGGIKKKNKKYFNLIANYSCKKESKNIILKENKNSSQNIKPKKYKSFSFSNKKIQKRKSIFSEKEKHLKNKNKSKGEIKYNLLLNNKNNNPVEKEISDNKSNKKISKVKTQQIIKKDNLLNNLIKVKKNKSFTNKNEFQKLLFLGKKLEYLQSHNIEISKTESNIEKEEENKNIEKTYKNPKSKIKNITIMKCENNNQSNKINKKQKPIVDQFEYIKKINTIHSQASNTSKTINIFKYYNLTKNENKNPPKSLNINTYKNNNKEKKKNDKIVDGYLFTNKKNYRKKEELNIFTKKKNSKEKKRKEKNETEKTKKIYKKFKNLYKLCLENLNFINQQKNRKTLNIKGQNIDQIRKRRVRNNYYVGFDKTKNDSTFIEPKEYFLTLYQSKQLITNLNNEFEITNYNIHKKKEIKPNKNINNNKDVKNFIKILKNIFQKKTLVDLYFMYFKKKYYHHYFLSFKFFIAIMKQYAFKKIYYNNISEKKEKIKKVIYLVEILSLILKIKVFENIYLYSQQKEIKTIKENLEKIVKIARKVILYYFFTKIKNFKINKSDNIDKKYEINEVINDEINKDINEEINDEINNELNENENIINNNLDNIYTEGLKNMIDEINNTDEENSKFKKINYDFKNNEIEIPLEDIPKKTKINYFNIIINNNINNVLNDIKKNNISDEKEINSGKFWEYQIDDKKEKENFKINIINENKKNIKEFDELFGEIRQMKSFSECSGLNNESKSSKDNTNNEKNKIKENKNKTNKEINISLKKDIKVLNIIRDKEKPKVKEDIKIEDNQRNMNIFKEIIKGNNIDNFVETITENIIKMICDTEITYKDKLLPIKQNNNIFNTDSLKVNQNSSSISMNNIQKNDDIISKDLNSLGIENKIINNSNTSLDKSLIFSSSIYSIFNKTISEQRKELNENFFFENVFPKLIKIIKEELINKHKKIFNFIVTPVKIDIKDIIVSINMNNENDIIQNYKEELFKENLDEIINKKDLLNHFNQVNNEIRKKYFLENEFFYDKILNYCLIDFLIETIKKERLLYNLENNNFFLFVQNIQIESPHNILLNDKNKFANYLCKSMISLLLTKLGSKQNELYFINENKIKQENEIKLNNEIKKEIIERDKENINDLKIEEMKIKFEIADDIFNLLLKETVEILENVQNNRKNFDNKYNKSIYKIEDNLDDKYNNYYGDDEDDIINY